MSKIFGFLHGALLCSLAALAACSSKSGDHLEAVTQPGVQAGVVVVSGNHQTAPVGTELPQPLVGRVIDAAGNALSNRSVTFVVTSGGGSMSVGFTTSDSSGQFSGRWTLGPSAGTQRVEVRGTDSNAPAVIYATFESVATAGAATGATALAGTQGQAAKMSTAVPTPIGVRVVDLYGNAKSGVRVWFTPCETCGSANPASAMTNAGGVATSMWTLGTSTGTQRLSATLAGLPAVGFEALAMPNSSAEVLSLTARQGDGQTVEQHARNAQPLGVFVSDGRGAGVPGIAVDFLPAPGSAYFAAQTINTNAEGYADFTSYFHDAGAVRVEATVAGVQSATFDLAVTATPFDYDGDFTCRFADAPGSPYSMSVRQSSASAGDVGTDVAADGTFALEWRAGSIRRRLQGRIEVGIDGGAGAIGTTVDSAAAMPWSCERL